MLNLKLFDKQSSLAHLYNQPKKSIRLKPGDFKSCLFIFTCLLWRAVTISKTCNSTFFKHFQSWFRGSIEESHPLDLSRRRFFNWFKLGWKFFNCIYSINLFCFKHLLILNLCFYQLSILNIRIKILAMDWNIFQDVLLPLLCEDTLPVINWLKHHNLLAREANCTDCGRKMNWTKYCFAISSINKFSWHLIYFDLTFNLFLINIGEEILQLIRFRKSLSKGLLFNNNCQKSFFFY